MYKKVYPHAVISYRLIWEFLKMLTEESSAMDFTFFLCEEMVVISRAAAVVEILATAASSVEIPSLDEMVAGSGILELSYYIYIEKFILQGNFFYDLPQAGDTFP